MVEKNICVYRQNNLQNKKKKTGNLKKNHFLLDNPSREPSINPCSLKYDFLNN